MSNLVDFVQEQLYPEIYEHLDTIFPEMGFRRFSGGWRSPKKLDGTESSSPRPDKSVVTRRKPQRVLEQGGDSLSLIDFYSSLNGVDFLEAVKRLSAAVGLELPPMEESESYRAYKERQEELERASASMERDLFTDGGRSTLDYLRTGRGYSEEFIKWGSFGYISPERAEELRPLFTYKNREGEEVCALPYGVGTVYTLSIPYRTEGRISGFVFRNVDENLLSFTTKDGKPGKMPKYKDAFISASASKKYHLFGLSGLRLTGDGEKDRDLTVVEGEIDALRAQFAGVENVVAAAGGTLSAEALSRAKKKGVKRVTLLFDTEESEEKQESTYKKTEKAVRAIAAAGLRPFVAVLPSPSGKMDVDSYLSELSGEELKKEIDDAKPGALFLFWRIYTEAEAKTGEGGATTYKNLDELKQRVLDLITDREICSPTDEDLILSDLSTATGGAITKESLRDEAESIRKAEEAKRTSTEARTAAGDFLRKMDSGNVSEALDFMEGKISAIKERSRETDFRELLLIPSESELFADFKNKPGGVPTNYEFGGERFILPAGALTYICAPTSHGKSRFLENLAVQIATNGNAGSVLYFTFEEDATAVRLQLLNVFMGTTITNGNNLRTLEQYYREGATRYFKKGTFELFKKKEREFSELITSGRLRVFHKSYDSEELRAAIKYISGQIKVQAVFIDYIQMIHKRGTKLIRKDELRDICKDFMDVSIETGLPIVLAAQLNREALSPVDMDVQNIAEASEIEQSANTVLLLWNSKVKPRPVKGATYFADRKKGTLTDEAEKLQERGFNIGVGGKIYATLAKNRGGERNIDAVLDFDGNTGVIKGNYVPKEPEEGNLYPEDDGAECPY